MTCPGSCGRPVADQAGPRPPSLAPPIPHPSPTRRDDHLVGGHPWSCRARASRVFSRLFVQVQTVIGPGPSSRPAPWCHLIAEALRNHQGFGKQPTGHSLNSLINSPLRLFQESHDWTLCSSGWGLRSSLEVILCFWGMGSHEVTSGANLEMTAG